MNMLKVTRHVSSNSHGIQSSELEEMKRELRFNRNGTSRDNGSVRQCSFESKRVKRRTSEVSMSTFSMKKSKKSKGNRLNKYKLLQ